MDQCLRQPFGHDRRLLEVVEAQRDGEGLRAYRRDRHPARHATDLVAGALDQRAARLQPRRHARPRIRHVGLGILTQHVECANHGGPSVLGQGSLEAAEGERDPRIGGERRGVSSHGLQLLIGRAHPVGRDLESDHLDIGAHPGQPLLQLEGGDAARPAAEVDDERIVALAQHGHRRDEAVDAAQAIGVCRSSGDFADRHASSSP